MGWGACRRATFKLTSSVSETSNPSLHPMQDARDAWNGLGVALQGNARLRGASAPLLHCLLHRFAMHGRSPPCNATPCEACEACPWEACEAWKAWEACPREAYGMQGLRTPPRKRPVARVAGRQTYWSNNGEPNWSMMGYGLPLPLIRMLAQMEPSCDMPQPTRFSPPV
jgi:hypothetical protein